MEKEEIKEHNEKLIAKAKKALEYLKLHPICGIHSEVNLNIVKRIEKEGKPQAYDSLHIEETAKVIQNKLANLRQEIYGEIDHGFTPIQTLSGMARTNIAHKLSKKIIERIKDSITDMIMIK